VAAGESLGIETPDFNSHFSCEKKRVQYKTHNMTAKILFVFDMNGTVTQSSVVVKSSGVTLRPYTLDLLRTLTTHGDIVFWSCAQKRKTIRTLTTLGIKHVATRIFNQNDCEGEYPNFTKNIDTMLEALDHSYRAVYVIEDSPQKVVQDPNRGHVKATILAVDEWTGDSTDTALRELRDYFRMKHSTWAQADRCTA
jgi:hypothetical protein